MTEGKDTIKKLVEKYPKIAFAIPTYKTIPAKTFHDFQVFFSHMRSLGFKVSQFFLDQTVVCIARNKLVGHFLDAHNSEDWGPYNLLMWLDSDHAFKCEDFLDLLKSYDDHDEIKVLSGSYVTRDNESPRICAFMRDKEEKYTSISYNGTGLMEVDTFGFGFVMMSPDMIQHMYDEYGLHQFAFECVGPKEKGDMIGEDMSWCIKAKKLGYKMYFNADVKIGHVGSIMDHNYMKSFWSNKER